MRIFILAVCIFAMTLKAQDLPRFELGVMLGEPSSLSAKWWYGKRGALDIAAGWSFGEGGQIDIHSDYLVHLIYPPIEKGEMPLYTGLGLSLRMGNQAFFGGRVPFGIEYLIPGVPLSVFGEIAPIIQIIPENKVVISGGAGIRLNFGTSHQ